MSCDNAPFMRTVRCLTVANALAMRCREHLVESFPEAERAIAA